MSVEIRANTVLPARREPLRLRTSDGLTLVGELASPVGRPATATLVTLHPLPTHGGMMDSHVLRKASFRLPALAGVAVLRFNTRGTRSTAGRSDGHFEAGVGELKDVESALSFAAERQLAYPWLLGWSFGTDLALRHGPDPRFEGLILLSPPLRDVSDTDLDAWADSAQPVVALVPELDDYLRPPQARQRFAPIPSARVVGFDGAKHLWVGERAVQQVLDAVVDVVAPGCSPLPRTWDGPFDVATVTP
ncbi:MAG: alpha/beta hydrolase [Actinomycetes bacterium]